jgi:hypothetical protein
MLRVAFIASCGHRIRALDQHGAQTGSRAAVADRISDRRRIIAY